MPEQFDPWVASTARTMVRRWAVAGTAAVVIRFNGSVMEVSAYSPGGDDLGTRTVRTNAEWTRGACLREAHALSTDMLGAAGVRSSGSVDQSMSAKQCIEALRDGRHLAPTEQDVPATPVPNRRTRLPYQQHTPEKTEMENEPTFQDPTMRMIIDGGIFAGKVVTAVQAQRLVTAVAQKAALALARKTIGADSIGNVEEFLNSPAGRVLVDITTPVAIHALCTHTEMVPKGEAVAAACSLAYQGQMIKHGIIVTDLAADIMVDIAGELAALADLGMAMVSPAAEAMSRTTPDNDTALPALDDTSFQDQLDQARLEGFAEGARKRAESAMSAETPVPTTRRYDG